MKTSSVITTIIVSSISLSLLVINAQEKGKGKGMGQGGRPGGPPQPEFGSIDADGNGEIDKAEWVVFQVQSALERADRSFTMLAGSDEAISSEELASFANMRRGPGMSDGPGGGMGKGKGEKGKGMSESGKGKGEKGRGEKGGKGKGTESTGKGVAPKRPALEE